MDRSKHAVWFIVFLHILALQSFSQSRSVPPDKKGQRFEKSFALGEKPVLILENSSVQGNIEVQVWDRSEIKIIAEIHSPNISIAATSSNGVLTIKLDRKGVVSTEPVDFRVWAPAACEVELSSMGGKIVVRGVRGRLKALTTEGDIELLDVAGQSIDAISSTSGSITLSGQLVDQGKYNLYTASGQLNVSFNEPASFILDAATREGRIEAKGFRLSDEKRSHYHLQGVYGTGQVMLILRTYKGPISLEKQ